MTEVRTRALSTFVEISLFTHAFLEGHFVPSKASWRTFLKAYMLSPTSDVPSPGLISASQPGSGTVTPLTG